MVCFLFMNLLITVNFERALLRSKSPMLAPQIVCTTKCTQQCFCLTCVCKPKAHYAKKCALSFSRDICFTQRLFKNTFCIILPTSFVRQTICKTGCKRCSHTNGSPICLHTTTFLHNKTSHKNIAKIMTPIDTCAHRFLTFAQQSISTAPWSTKVNEVCSRSCLNNICCAKDFCVQCLCAARRLHPFFFAAPRAQSFYTTLFVMLIQIFFAG